MGTIPASPEDSTSPAEGTAAHHSRYPKRIEHSDVFMPKVELAATASDADRATNDSDYAAYQQRYSDAVQPATPSRPRHAAAATARRRGATRVS